MVMLILAMAIMMMMAIVTMMMAIVTIMVILVVMLIIAMASMMMMIAMAIMMIAVSTPRALACFVASSSEVHITRCHDGLCAAIVGRSDTRSAPTLWPTHLDAVP